jgi:two-component system phosphate regulon sensor histidine kinase PhoR
MKWQSSQWTLGLIAFLLATLLGMQMLWQWQWHEKKQKEFDVRMLYILNKVRAKLHNVNDCVNLFSKPAVNPQEGLYILKQRWNEDGFYGKADTVRLFLDTQGLKKSAQNIPKSFGDYRSSLPTYAQISMQILYNDADSVESSLNLNQDLLMQQKSTAVFDSVEVRKFIEETLQAEQIEDSFGFGFQDLESRKVLWMNGIRDTSDLLEAKHRIDLLRNDPFLKPQVLSLIIYSKSAIWLQFSPAMISAGVLLLLIILMWILFRYFKQQKSLSDLKTDFMNNLNHEMNTPITNIQLAIESAQRLNMDDPDKLQRLHHIIFTESQKLQHHIDRSLQIGILESGTLPLHKQPLDLYALLLEVCQAHHQKLDKISAICILEDHARPQIYADRFHLLNAFSNLVDNAIKYRHDKRVLELRIELAEDNQDWMIRLSDNGIGLKPEHRKMVFEKFYRAQSGLVHATKGFGLGLSYTKAVIDLHQGSIDVLSEFGKGSVFIVRFPKTPHNP